MNETTPETGAWTARRFLALLGSVLLWAIILIDIWYLWPTTLGGSTSLVIVSGSSMEPTYQSGDLVIARDIEPSVGDIIVYTPEGFGDARIVHRITGGNGEDGWIVQGDNNTTIDPFEPTNEEVRGVAVVHYSNVGRIAGLLVNPIFWAAFLLAGLVLLLWTSGEDDDEDDEDDPELATEPEPDVEAASEEATAAGIGGVVTRVLAIFALTGALVVGTAGVPAFASGLGVTAPALPANMSNSACATSPWGSAVAGTPSGGNYTQVQMTSIPLACQGLSATVYLYDASNTLLTTGTATPNAATYTFTTGSYSGAAVTRVWVKVSGWPLRSAWNPPPAAFPAVSCQALNIQGNPTGQQCTVTITGLSSWISYPGAWGVGTPYYHYYLSFDVATIRLHWNIRVDWSNTSQFPLYNAPPVYVGNGYNVTNASGYSCSSLPVYVGRKAAGQVLGQNNGNLYATTAPGSTNGTTQLCP